MWRLVCVALATIWLVVVFGATAYAQALAPSALNLASHDQKTGDDMVQVITEKSAGKNPDKPITAITKKRAPVIARKPPKQVKEESVPVITQYYPKQMVYPFGRVDRHIDSRLMQAASIAQERAHAHSRSRCWHYVKEAL